MIDAWRIALEALKADPATQRRVELAVTDPSAYVEKHRKELHERGVSKPAPQLARIALFDGLEASGRVALVDHRAFPEDVVDALGKLKPRLRLAKVKSLDEELPVERVLAIAAAANDGSGLVSLDDQSDEYVIVVVESSAVATVTRALKKVGLRPKLIKPQELRVERKRVVAAVKVMTPWPDATNEASGTWRYFVHFERQRSMCLAKYAIAFDVLSGPLGGNHQNAKKTFADAAACSRAYLEQIETLARDGWAQLEAAEHAKAGRAAAKK